MEPAEIVETVKASGLRGRGGAGFPTGLKWSFLPPDDGLPRYLVVNADESEPGTCKDIPTIMANPHVLIEGIAITSRAINCHHAFVYLRGEVVHVYRRLMAAVKEATEAGWVIFASPLTRVQVRTSVVKKLLFWILWKATEATRV